MPDYQLGKIYKIVDNTNGNIYVGSTCEPTLARRLSKHVSDYKCWKKGIKPSKSTSVNIIANGNYDILLIEEYPCETKDQLHAKEGFYIKQLECINKCIMTRTMNEWRADNENEIKEYNKNYRKENINIILEKEKKYRNENKEEIKQRCKHWRLKNADKISEKHLCDCGGSYIKRHQKEHEQTKKHKEYLKSN